MGWYVLGYFLSIFDPKNLSKINQKNVNFWAQWQDDPKRAIRSFKEPKSCIFKNLKKTSRFWRFLGPEASQESLKRPKKALKRNPKSSKKLSKSWLKIVPKMIRNLPKSLVQKGFKN